MSFTKMSSSRAHLSLYHGWHLPQALTCPCGGYFSRLPAFLPTFVIFPTQVVEYRGLETTTECTRECKFRTHRRHRLLWCLSFRIFSLCLSQFKQTISFINILQWIVQCLSSNRVLNTSMAAWALYVLSLPPSPFSSLPRPGGLSMLYAFPGS